MKEKLVELGLSKNEAAIYLFLLKNPETTTEPIIKETGIANSRVYESLNSLIKKGFANYAIHNNGKHFSASRPESLLEKEDEQKKKIELIIPELNKIANEKRFKTKTAVFEGFDGFKTAFKKIIDDCPKNESIYILGFSEKQISSEILQTFLTNMNLKSAQKKQKLKIILDSSARQNLGRDREKEKYSEVRYMPKGYISPAAIDIFLDYVYIFLWEEKPFVFMIKNEKIADSFKNYHEFLWKISKKHI